MDAGYVKVLKKEGRLDLFPHDDPIAHQWVAWAKQHCM